MLNDFHMMVLALVASQGGIAVLLLVMAKLEPTKQDTTAQVSAARPVARHVARQVVRRSSPRPAAPAHTPAGGHR